MDELICEKCGAHNSASLHSCHLCGASLNAQREQLQSRGWFVSLGVAIVATIICAVAPGVVIYKAILEQPEDAHSAMFFVIGYLVFWVLALRYRHHYQSRSSYDFGIYSMTLSYTKRIRHERDQQHFLLGCLLIPVNVVGECWQQVFAQKSLPDDNES